MYFQGLRITEIQAGRASALTLIQGKGRRIRLLSELTAEPAKRPGHGDISGPNAAWVLAKPSGALTRGVGGDYCCRSQFEGDADLGCIVRDTTWPGRALSSSTSRRAALS